ncbi:DNA replication protein DnaC [Anaerosphaera aminiphila DSM 21120]|uniref:DNA replication protein DnaC n=1 Tax=Anaerosphaera aminiphila DSM 21120 TaxID=1120995 RepID=A0A1M5SAU9_9FIRM|nr:ATP-binding protein [Anaerosphaera aminiphila]SHH35428.1 DNA replication protein DnaC [Anaerosphaera aminiphila DSM 21120]
MKDMFRKIEREYELQRDKNRREMESRKEEVYSSVPEIKNIDQCTSTLGFDALKSQIKSPSLDELRKINEDIYALRGEKEKLLLENGYSRNYLDDIYNCEDCKDTGVLEDGSRCHCMQAKIARELYSISNMSYTLTKENFNTFDLGIFSTEIYKSEGISPRENMEMILMLSRKFVKTFYEKNDMNLLFYGATGQGKTFMLNCIAKELLDRNVAVIYQTAFNTIELVEDRKFRRNEVNSVKYSLLFDCELLIIDDLGIEFTNSFSASEIFNIVNTRILRGKKTLISTNLSPNELTQKYTDRVFSRVFQKFEPIKFFGEDLRLKINS